MSRRKLDAPRTAGRICMALGLAMVLAAAALLLYNRVEDARAGSASQEILSSLVQEIGEPHALTLPETGAGEAAAASTEMATVEIHGYAYIGYLSIPALELELPVMSEWSYAQLKLSPCRYLGSTAEENFIICGHNYDRHFGRLQYLQPGDLVTFTDVTGTVFTYEVVELETLDPTEISEMLESDYDLTLFTCTYNTQNRVTVRCNRVGE